MDECMRNPGTGDRPAAGDRRAGHVPPAEVGMTPNLRADNANLTPAPNPTEADRPEPRRLPATSFRSRHSALSDAQRQTWERLWPEFGMSEPGRPLHGSVREEAVRKEPLDTRAWFGREAPVVLEIGCGSGTSTLA